MDASILGSVIAVLGAALAVIMTGVGSAIGMSWVQQSAAGLVAEEPEKYGKTMILQLVPSSNALYGFVTGFLVVVPILFGGGGYATVADGLLAAAFCLPIAIVGMVACLCQAKVCVAGVNMIAKRGELSGTAIVMAVFIELFALFALIISVLGILTLTGM